MNKLYRLKFISFCLFFTLLFGCTPDIEENIIVTYRGMVQENTSKEPLSNIDVIVTDGSNIHSMTKTDIDGSFNIKVKVNEIDENYYILIGDETCEQKQIKFPGFSDETINLGLISVVGPQLPIVNTNPNFSIDVNNLYCGGTVINSGRLDVTDRGICYSLSSYPTISDSKVSEGKGEGKFELVIKNLELGSIYYFRAFATNSKGTSYGIQYRVKMEEGVATVSDVQISEIKATNAVCSAEVINDGGFEIVKRGFCWSKQQFPTTSDCVVTDGGKIGKFSLSLSDLEPQTTYYVRAFAENSTSVTYSDQLKFETISGLPTVVTGDVINISSNSAECSGVISDNGGYTINKCGVCWSKSTSTPTVNDSHTEDISLSGKFNSVITSLQPSTVYYIRAYATNSMGTVYGQTKKITTTDGKPIVSTSTSYTNGKDYLIISGSATTEANAPIIRKGICWSSHANPSTKDEIVIANSNTESFTCRIDGLSSWSTYYCCAFAENSYGLSYGKTYQFSTERTPARLLGRVLDQDGNPIANASVRGYDNWFGATTDKDGNYVIEFSTIARGEYQFSASATDYESSGVRTINIIKGQDNYFDFVLNLTSPWAIDLGTGVFKDTGQAWEIIFECTQSSFAGQKTTRNIRLKNYRSVPVSWEITNIPSTGVTLSQTNGTIPANGEIFLTLTFTYPSTSSYMVKLPGCSSGTKTYVYIWDMVNTGCYFMYGNYYDAPCYACCGQNVIVNVGDYTEAFSLIFNQKVSYK